VDAAGPLARAQLRPDLPLLEGQDAIHGGLAAQASALGIDDRARTAPEAASAPSLRHQDDGALVGEPDDLDQVSHGKLAERGADLGAAEGLAGHALREQPLLQALVERDQRGTAKGPQPVEQLPLGEPMAPARGRNPQLAVHDAPDQLRLRRFIPSCRRPSGGVELDFSHLAG
jgi:hypothetical protein